MKQVWEDGKKGNTAMVGTRHGRSVALVGLAVSSGNPSGQRAQDAVFSEEDRTASRSSRAGHRTGQGTCQAWDPRGSKSWTVPPRAASGVTNVGCECLRLRSQLQRENVSRSQLRSHGLVAEGRQEPTVTACDRSGEGGSPSGKAGCRGQKDEGQTPQWPKQLTPWVA